MKKPQLMMTPVCVAEAMQRDSRARYAFGQAAAGAARSRERAARALTIHYRQL